MAGNPNIATIREASEILDCDIYTLKNAVQDGRIPYSRQWVVCENRPGVMQRRYMIVVDLEDAEAFIDIHRSRLWRLTSGVVQYRMQDAPELARERGIKLLSAKRFIYRHLKKCGAANGG